MWAALGGKGVKIGGKRAKRGKVEVGGAGEHETGVVTISCVVGLIFRSRVPDLIGLVLNLTCVLCESRLLVGGGEDDIFARRRFGEKIQGNVPDYREHSR